ncbi:MAG TPA: methyltransferase domain-containing protein [Blastocatellia bacterium]
MATNVAGPRVLAVGDDVQCTDAASALAADLSVTQDAIKDFDDLPYPFADSQFDEVTGCYLVERSSDPMALMAELHRITRPGGLIKLRELHWTNPEFASDLRNRNHLSSYSFRNLTMERVVYEFYTDIRFKQRAARITMPLVWKLMGFEFCVNLDNRYPGLRFFRQIWEHYLNCVVRGKEIHFELEVLKR